MARMRIIRTPRFKVAIIHLSFQGTLQLSESEN